MKALNLKQAGSSLAVAVAAVAGMSVLGIDAAMAGTEFLRVVIDVENNTRKQLQP